MSITNQKYDQFSFGPLLIKTKIHPEDLEKIKKVAEKKGRTHHQNLAGVIEKEYVINMEKFVPIVSPYFETFVHAARQWSGQIMLGKMKFVDAWVNYMVAGEYNPPHVHSNCNISSVLFLKVPKTLKKENDYWVKEKKIQSSGPGTIMFMYGELGFYTCIDRTFLPEEGDLFIFPASLRHFVAPFVSKGERISIAANAVLE